MPNLYSPQPLTLLVLGYADSGKSWLAADWSRLLAELNGDPDGKQTTIIFDLEDGYKALAPKARILRTPAGDSRKTADTVVKALAALRGKGALVVVDGLSEQELETLGRLRKEGKTDREDELKPSWEAWNDLLVLFVQMAQAAKHSGLHFLCTARVDTARDPADPLDEDKSVYVPGVRGKFGRWASHYFDAVAYMEEDTDRGVHRLWFRTPLKARWRTRNRWRHLMADGKRIIPVYLEWRSGKEQHIKAADVLDVIKKAQEAAAMEAVAADSPADSTGSLEERGKLDA